MSFDITEKQWKCGKGGAVNLHRVSSIVRDIGEPCLHPSPIKVVIAITRMLKPEKWQSTFDSDGKIFGFKKVLKLIILGGVDPTIRGEVWEFLLGCYSLSSTADYRKQLRTIRRERYKELIKQCQTMHSSIGTGSLAYVVGSKVMDMRTSSKDTQRNETEPKSGRSSDINSINLDNSPPNWDEEDSKDSTDSNDLITVRQSTDETAYDSSSFIPTEPYFDFPSLPVTDLFEKNQKNKKVSRKLKKRDDKNSSRRKLKFGNETQHHMHSFQISNNAELVVESNNFTSHDVLNLNLNTDSPKSETHESITSSSKVDYETDLLNTLRISDVPITPSLHASTSHGGVINEEKVSEWLWTLHQIVVDVVRTDSHLEFYEDSKNLARMSDILAVYAWVDPATGYCQGMSDLLSPFVVLFEDNADAFWCFEMLLRRMRENFQMEGPTGVMKQLEALWHILELTDKDMFAHLSRIGAESLHFAFRMLLVLFRRELSFNEAICMWEMMWAADFNESISRQLENNCPQLLHIQTPNQSGKEKKETNNYANDQLHKDGSGSENNETKTKSPSQLCGLTKNFWSRTDHLQNGTGIVSSNEGDDELPVFCVAAILVMNRHKIMRETSSIDDLIKIFNDKMLKFRVKRCVRTAIKLRKKYIYKLIKSRNPTEARNDE